MKLFQGEAELGFALIWQEWDFLTLYLFVEGYRRLCSLGEAELGFALVLGDSVLRAVVSVLSAVLSVVASQCFFHHLSSHWLAMDGSVPNLVGHH